MPSSIDATKPVDGFPADKADLRANFEAARTELDHGGFIEDFTPTSYSVADTKTKSHITALHTAIGPGQQDGGSVSPEINAALFGNRQFHSHRCTNVAGATVFLANDVPAGKIVEIVQYAAAGTVTVQAGSGATLVKPASAVLTTTAQYQSMSFIVDSNGTGTAAAWRLISGPPLA